jgi:hypothetical protein
MAQSRVLAVMDTRTIKARGSHGELIEIHVQISKSKMWTLQYSDPDGTLHSFEVTDAFKAMQDMREELERRGVQLLCAGARIDSDPSGMLRDMGGGLEIYILPTESRSIVPPILEIFDYAEPELVGTVQQQREDFQSWISSFVKPRPSEIEEARQHPNGCVYRIAGSFGPSDQVPPQAIVGVWKVNADGMIEGNFHRNEKYDPVKWPSSHRHSDHSDV